MSKQLHAGLLLEGVYNSLTAKYDKNRIKSLFNNLSVFEIEESDNKIVTSNKIDPIIAVYSNLLSRGIPTLASIYVEEKFSELFNKTHFFVPGDKYYDKNKYKKNYSKVSFTDEETEYLYKALHIVDPRLRGVEITNSYMAKMGQDEEGKYKFEHSFFTGLAAMHIGAETAQLFDAQVSLEAILRMSKDENGEIRRMINSSPEKFLEQEVDFAYEFPYPINNKKGIIIEIDGSQHSKDIGQNKLDILRDHASMLSEWYTLRIPTNQFANIHKSLSELNPFFANEYFQLVKQNYKKPLYRSEQGKMACQIIGGPIVIGRIQKVILHEILKGNLHIDDDTWKIGIIERDISFAHIAIEDLKKTLNHLFTLEGQGRQVPQVEIQIFKGNIKEECENSNEFPLPSASKFKGDLLLDISLWQRMGRTACPVNEYVKNAITIRSVGVHKEKRKFHTDELIQYQSIIDLQDEDLDKIVFNTSKKNALEFFLQSIFRLKEYRAGQLRIIDMALQGKSVIGLLPTGGGKSLTYQICSLLQPGISLVIDPIKSLMKDQNDGLLKKFIDATTFINSSVKTSADRERRMNKFCNAEVIFTFISPERLLIQSFRDKLNSMSDEKNTWFAYCVVDEAHCVSEWGHDFRTPYLRLADNVKRFCKLKNPNKTIPIYGLTATASYDVLADVKRELNLTDESVIRNRDNTRLELNYKVWRSETDSNENDTNEWTLKKKIGEAKYKVLDQIVKDTPETLFELQNQIPEKIKLLQETGKLNQEHYNKTLEKLIIPNYNESSFYKKESNNEYNTGTIIFCPHKSGKIYSGVESVKNKLKQDAASNFEITTFYSTDEEDVTNEAEDNQEKFINGNSNLMIATKAFGMGIDKQNIRSTIHLNFPSSIESLVQEAGRAGRDGHIAMCNIIISDHIQFDEEINFNFLNNSFKGVEKEKYIIWELLNEISFPIDSNAQSLKELIRSEFDLDDKLSISLYPKINPDRIYIDTVFPQGFGCFFLKDYKILLKNDYDQKLCNKILKRAVEYVKETVPNGMSVEKWFNTESSYRKLPGIERILEDMNWDESKEGIVIGFRNNSIHSIFKKMVQLDSMITEMMVSSSLNFVTDAEEFFQKLEINYYRLNGKYPDFTTNDIKDEIQKLILTIRNEQDTFKAVYRLSILGIIDDYIVDYGKKCIYLTIKKLKDEQIRTNLYNYLIRYLSKEKAIKELDKINSLKGNSFIQKSLGFLMGFIYESIRERRIRGIKEVRKLCEDGEEKGGEVMAQDIDLYFHAKYIEDIRKKTDGGKHYTQDLIWDYIKEVEFSIDNLNHLRGSTTRILSDQPNNAALLILNAYAIICLEAKTLKGKLKIGSHRLMNEALKDLAFGLAVYHDENGEYLQILNRIKDYLNEFNQELHLLLDQAELMIQAEVLQYRLKSFNDLFKSE